MKLGIRLRPDSEELQRPDVTEKLFLEILQSTPTQRSLEPTVLSVLFRGRQLQQQGTLKLAFSIFACHNVVMVLDQFMSGEMLSVLEYGCWGTGDSLELQHC